MSKVENMTRQEAIEMIQDDIRRHHDSLSGTYRHALNMAIKALEKPDFIYCQDCKYMKEKECYKDARLGSPKEIKMFCGRTLWDFQVSPEFFCFAGEKK